MVQSPQPPTRILVPHDEHQKEACNEDDMAFQEEATPVQDADEFAQLQAILAGLPMHAVPPPVFSRSCGLGAAAGCGGQRRPPPLVDGAACKERICIALEKARADYPDRHVLAELEVEHASLDLVCFVNHSECQIFTAVRGTDRMMNPLTTPRDVHNDLLIAVGMTPVRTFKARDEYVEVKSRFPNYVSYATGHSLGGNIVEHLALDVEDKTDFRFSRVDVFNTGASPLRGAPIRLQSTDLHAHRVPGDWASMYHTPAGGRVHVHNPKEDFKSRHVLGHFLPQKRNLNDVRSAEAGAIEREQLTGFLPRSQDEGAEEVEFVPVGQTPTRPESMWMSLLSCAGCRKGKIVRSSERILWSQSARRIGDDDRWRNFEPFDDRPPGVSPRELDEIHFANGGGIETEPLLRPHARSEEEEDHSLLPSSQAAMPILQIRLARALDRAITSGELVESLGRVRENSSVHAFQATCHVQTRFGAALDRSLHSGELATLLKCIRVEKGITFWPTDDKLEKPSSGHDEPNDSKRA